MQTSVSLLAILGFGVASSALAEIISDLSTSPLDESRALSIKKEQFWRAVMESTDVKSVSKHVQLCDEADAFIEQLPPQNTYVHDKLREASMRLRRANEALLTQAVSTSEEAQKRLAEAGGGASWTDGVSFSNAFSSAIRMFVGEGDYFQRLAKDVANRQAETMPVLRGAANSLGGVLGDCRKVSSLGFDIHKYNIYNRGTPETPSSAKALADRFIEAARTTRQEFMALTMGPIHSLVKDTQGKAERPAATVVHAELEQQWQSFGMGSSQETEQLINM